MLAEVSRFYENLKRPAAADLDEVLAPKDDAHVQQLDKDFEGKMRGVALPTAWLISTFPDESPVVLFCSSTAVRQVLQCLRGSADVEQMKNGVSGVAEIWMTARQRFSGGHTRKPPRGVSRPCQRSGGTRVRNNQQEDH